MRPSFRLAKLLPVSFPDALTPMKIDLHPACELFPKLGDSDLHELANNIKENGLIDPIVLLDGKVLDGRNRLAACEIAGVTPRFKEFEGEGSPLAWVVATNLYRRHLTPSQRAVVAFDLLPMLEVEAKERQRRSPGRGKKLAKPLATLSSGKSSQFAAKIAKSNSAYVEKVKSISKKAPEIIAEVKSGRITLNEAVRLSVVDPKLRKKIINEAHKKSDQPVKRLMRKLLVEHSASQPLPPNSTKKSTIEIWCGDCVKLMQDRIEDESISCVVTSPPYNQGIPYRTYDDNMIDEAYFEWMGKVFTEINRVLKPDGSLFLIIGHSARKPWTAMQVAFLANHHFKLQNQIVWVKSISIEGKTHGHFSPVTSKRFLNHLWEPIYHFTKNGNAAIDRLSIGVPYTDSNNEGTSGAKLRCQGDVWFVPHETIHGAEERFEHPATFPPEISRRCIKLAGINDETKVLDPFCGVNGMVAASQLGVDGIGIDIDSHYCKISRKRLSL